MENQVATPTLKKQPASYSVSINAPVAKIWQALTDPSIIKQYFLGTHAHSDFKAGSPITYTGEWNGTPYKDKGTILKSEPNKVLQHTYWSSMSHLEDKPENYITVTYTLNGNDKQTQLTVDQNMCVDKTESEKMWKDILNGLKKTVESNL